MPYQSATSDVREESGNILDIDFSDAEIQEEQQAAYDIISGEIGEYDETHPKINGIKKIEIKLAASFVLDHFNQYKDAASKKAEQAHKLLEYMKKGLAGGAADISDYFAVTSYQSYSAAESEDPEQTTIVPYSSIRPGYYYGMGVGGRGEPWQKPWYFYDKVKTPRC
jgi:hypothetical protein